MKGITLGIMLLVFVLLAFSYVPKTFVVLPQSKELPSNSPNRNLTLYEQGKTYDFSLGNVKTRRAERNKFREFLWQQWSKQRRARVTATFYSVEGDPTISTYYIEPNESGQWHIFVESESECCWTYAMQKPKKQRERRKYSTTYSGLERVQEVQDKNGIFLKWKLVPEDKQLPPQSYMLRLKKGDEESLNVF
jgi:nuclear transport factor 2 (NTF2) superfamily protein